MRFSLLLSGFALGVSTAMAAGAVDKGVPYQQAADMLYHVMASDRSVYNRIVVQRLTIEDYVITAKEHFEDDSALPLPAQMFRFGAEEVSTRTDDFSYSLLSLTPINKNNIPGTELEREGLEYVDANPGERFYGEEEVGGTRRFVGVYADIVNAESCAACHNRDKRSPRRDFKFGDVMGGVVIRIPMD